MQIRKFTWDNSVLAYNFRYFPNYPSCVEVLCNIFCFSLFSGPVPDYFEGIYPMRDLPGISFPFTGFLGSPGSLKPRPGEPLQVVTGVGNLGPLVDLWAEGGARVFQPILASGGMGRTSENFPWTVDGAAGRSPTEMYLREIIKIASSVNLRGSLAFEPFLRDTPDDREFLRLLRLAWSYAPRGLVKNIESTLSATDRYLRNAG